jgi:hypothetical protein
LSNRRNKNSKTFFPSYFIWSKSSCLLDIRTLALKCFLEFPILICSGEDKNKKFTWKWGKKGSNVITIVYLFFCFN